MGEGEENTFAYWVKSSPLTSQRCFPLPNASQASWTALSATSPYYDGKEFQLAIARTLGRRVSQE